MRTVGVIQARMGSTRLPGKVLAPIGTRRVLALMLSRVERSRLVDRWLVATTTDPEDDPIAALCDGLGVESFRGSVEDVLDRYYRATEHSGADAVVRLTADCPLIDPELIDRCVRACDDGAWDFVATTAPPPGSFPEGMDVEVLRFSALEASWQRAVLPSEREHVTFHIWKRPGEFRLMRLESPHDWSRVRLTVDYPEDLEVIRRLAAGLGERIIAADLAEMIGWLDAHPDVLALNRHCEFGSGWKPALAEDARRAR